MLLSEANDYRSTLQADFLGFQIPSIDFCNNFRLLDDKPNL